MKQQRKGKNRNLMGVYVSRKAEQAIRRIARKRNYSISGVAHELIQDGLRRQGYLKPDDED